MQRAICTQFSRFARKNILKLQFCKLEFRWHEQRTQLKTLGSAVISTSYMSHSLPNRRSTGSRPEWICPKCLYPSSKSKNLSWKQTKTLQCRLRAGQNPIWLPYNSQPITLQAFFDVISNYREHSRDMRESECRACGMG